MLNKKEYLLTVLAEEAVEIAQRATKALRFGLEETQPEQELNNTQRLVGEINDFFAVLGMLQAEGIEFDGLLNPAAITKKQDRVIEFMKRSREHGCLDAV